ncbi:unnamed protein product [Ceutorhynchus assimilis]|uniref:RanBP-type and C3HC4-type zinc finger-containing protein 1 n=1 Tax=Ceutorhynchus assimilis TaxID=467358 RepID=A0A9N9N123_9CUCU|nr:unnamed protein product [Ceutorhynchus assimilis]
MKVQDFEDIYSDKNGKNAAKLYANLAQNDELSLFFNVPKCNLDNKLSDINGESRKNINTDTIEINRLLRRLENAIGKGELTEAAIFAKELAQLKVNCSVIRQKAQAQSGGKHQGFQIEMYVEDKVSHRGPFPIDVTESQTVAELKQQIAAEFEIPVEVQRWILGKELVVDDNSSLKHHNITEGCPVFLYLVAPEKKPREFQTKKSSAIAQPSTSTSSNDSSTINSISINLRQTKNVNATTKKNDIPEPKKNKIEAPKIVNVIPKSSDVAKAEVIRIVPIQKGITNGKPESGIKPPSTVTEIKVDIKPYSSRYEKDDIKEEKTGLVRATATKIEVFQAPPLLTANINSTQKTPRRASVQQTSSHESSKSETVKTEVKEANISSTSASSDKSSTRIYPNLSNLSTTATLSQIAPNASIEEYDTNTLRPPKEWECHLCTLLNPDSSNICAVCATVRIKKTSLRRWNKKKPAPQPQKDQTYLQLVNLDSADLVANADVFECLVCFLEVAKGDGVTLRECLHQFCKDCLARTVEFSDDAEIKCPFRDEEYSCNIAMQDREIKALVSPDMYEQHLAKSMAQAENRMEKTFHCKTPDCKGWCIFEDNVNEFRCPVCRKTNCLTCQAIHMGANCKQYQERMKDESNMNEDARRTKDFLEEMVEKGEAIACPTCKVILMKKWGCDWLRCSMCKTEICWVTRGPRWGPGGKGDTSGGCKCGLNGVKCHPKCNYCH